MSNIKMGDLVMVVKPQPCCGGDRGVGRLFEVEAIENDYSTCVHCKAISKSTYAKRPNVNDWVSFSRLIKIDPPALPESLEREKELSV
jgi:hypothetical protein